MRNRLPSISNDHRKQTHQLDVPLRTLLGTGPSNIHSRVLQALSTQLIGQQEPVFLNLMHEIQELLRYVWQTDNAFTFPISGGDTAALEAAIASILRPGDTLLVGESGQLSERICKVAERYNVTVHCVAGTEGSVVPLDELQRAVEQYKPAMLALVHGELSTGVRQPLDGVGDLCRRHDTLLLVDSVGSLAAVPIYVDAWKIDVCFSSTDRCLSAVPGLGLLTVGQRAVEKMQRRRESLPLLTYCLHIEQLAQMWNHSDSAMCDSLPVNLLYALRESLRMIAEEGIVECWQRHRNNAELLWFGLSDLDLECPVAVEHRLASLTSIRVPDHVNRKAVMDHLLTYYNIDIASPGMPENQSVWRVGLMGFNSRPENVTLFLNALKEALCIAR